MEREMREQVGLLHENARAYGEKSVSLGLPRDVELVLLAARGSSDNAALYARYLIEIHLGIPVCLAAPSVITHYGSRLKYPRCLAIGISQSGAAPDVSEVLAAMRSQGHATLAITNTEDSRLTHEAEHTLLLEAGVEQSIAATKTYSLSLLALYQVVRALGANLPEPQRQLPTNAWFDECEEAAEASLGPIVRCNPIFALARGYRFSTALETALKLMECALIPAKSFSTADFQHGPRALASYGTAAIVFGETPDRLAETGTTVVTAPEGEPGPLQPLWDIFYGQWLALLAARARGLDPDRAQNLSKVTQTL